jgi:hypothetical protein
MLSGKGMWGRGWMRIKPHFPYVRKFILGLTATLGFLFHDAVPAYAGKAIGGWWRYNNAGKGFGVPLSAGPIGDIFLANERVGYDAVDDFATV